MGFQDSWWAISMLRLVILAAVVFVRYRADKQTHRQTDRQTVVKTLPQRKLSAWVIMSLCELSSPSCRTWYSRYSSIRM